MLLLHNVGDAVHPDLRTLRHEAFENLANRDILSDAPGVSVSSGYPGRSTVGSSDPHRQNEDRFAAHAAEALAQAAAGGQAAIVIVAPPATLSQLRQHYTANVSACIIAEIHKDLARHPIDAIAAILDACEA